MVVCFECGDGLRDGVDWLVVDLVVAAADAPGTFGGVGGGC